MLVKFDCGCIGIGEPLKDGKHIVLRICDSNYDEPEFCFQPRDFSSKAYEHVGENVEESITQDISKLIADGHKLRQIQGALYVKPTK